MARSRDIITRFLGDEKDLLRATRTVSKGADSAGNSMKEAGSKIKTFFAGAVAATVLTVAKRFDQLAVLAEGVRARTAVVFGEMTAQVEAWADANKKAFGLSQVQLLNLASATQDLLVPLGFTRDEATKLTKEVLVTGNALSEWTGGQVDAALAAEIMRKALLGEREQLESLGIKILESDVTRRLAEKGQKALTGAELERAKVLATLELITEKSTDALTAYSNTALTSLRRQKAFNSELAESSQKFADVLKPAMDDAKKDLATAADLVARLGEKIDDLTDSTDKSAEAFTFYDFTGLGFASGMVRRLIDEIKALKGDTDAATASADVLGDPRRFAIDYSKLAEGAGAAVALGEGLDEATTATERLMKAQMAFTDPVFRAAAAASAVRDAQTQAADALKTSGPKSDAYKDAVLDLAEAQLTLNAAGEGIPEWTRIAEAAWRRVAADADIPLSVLKEILETIYAINGTTIRPRFAEGATKPELIDRSSGVSFTETGLRKFHDGGVVPGPVGREQLALVKGGETVLPTHKPGSTRRSGPVNINVYGANPEVTARAVRRHLQRLNAEEA